jgi:hypothetical protein
LKRSPLSPVRSAQFLLWADWDILVTAGSCGTFACLSAFGVTQGDAANKDAAQQALLKRAKANSDAQLGKYDPATEGAEAGERTFEKGYVY